MSLFSRIFLTLALLAQFAEPVTAADSSPRLVLITLDGVRWQDVFRGPDPVLTENSHYTHEDLKESVQKAWIEVPDRGAALMPFLHEMARTGGTLSGNRDKGECMKVVNDMWFSYPGYNEILTGRPDNRITSNDKIYNPTVTFLEWLNRQPGFEGQVTAFGTWDVFPYIINDKRSGVPVNAGLGNRFPTDTLTARLALQTLRKSKPRVLYIGMGDTDELAHAGNYEQYLAAANRTDDFIRTIWETIEADPVMRGKTTLIVTTDHGRGEAADETWTEHSSKTYLEMYPTYLRDYTKTGIIGSDAIWFAAIGPGVKPGSPPASKNVTAVGACATQSQIAASALSALGIDWRRFDRNAGMPLPQFAP